LADAYFFSAVRVRGDSDRGEKAPRAEGEEAMVNLKTLTTTEDKRKKALASAMAAAVLAAGLITTTEAKPVHAAFTGQNGRIAFTSLRDGNPEIYTMNPDGMDQKRLTTDPSPSDFIFDEEPTVSPDGKKIAFTSNATIREMHVDGTKMKTITSENSGDSNWGVVTQ
jgi:Tol biopolymer transport system component